MEAGSISIVVPSRSSLNSPNDSYYSFGSCFGGSKAKTPRSDPTHLLVRSIAEFIVTREKGGVKERKKVLPGIDTSNLTRAMSTHINLSWKTKEGATLAGKLQKAVDQILGPTFAALKELESSGDSLRKEKLQNTVQETMLAIEFISECIPRLNAHEINRLSYVNKTFYNVCKNLYFQRWVLSVREGVGDEKPARMLAKKRVTSHKKLISSSDNTPRTSEIGNVEALLGTSLQELFRQMSESFTGARAVDDYSSILKECIEEFKKYPFLINLETLYQLIRSDKKVCSCYFEDLNVNANGVIFQSFGQGDLKGWPLFLYVKWNSDDDIQTSQELLTVLQDGYWKPFEDENVRALHRSLSRGFRLKWYVKKDANCQPPMGIGQGLIWIRDFYRWYYNQEDESYIRQLSLENLQKEFIQYFFLTSFKSKMEQAQTQSSSSRRGGGCNIL